MTERHRSQGRASAPWSPDLSAAPASLSLPLRGFNPDAWDRLNDCRVRVTAEAVQVDLPAWGGALLG